MKKGKLTLFLLCCSFALSTVVGVAQNVSDVNMNDLKNQLRWLNIESVDLAIDDMTKKHKLDKSLIEADYTELKALLKEGFKGLSDENTEVKQRAVRAVALHKKIMLQNPLLKDAQIYASRYKLDNEKTARSINTPQLGTQANNWSTQQSNKYRGYNADIIKISDLGGKTAIESLYAAKDGAVISDLHLNWSGKTLSFTTVTEDDRLNVYEISTKGQADATQLIKTEEPDLEFYDGIYLPNGKIFAMSNIGYQAVPCVHGDDPVGNPVLYDPATGELRRLGFDQESSWNPVVTREGKVMYTRWEYTDLMHYYSRMVMKMNPDGTEQKAIYGSGEMFPNSTFDLQPLPEHSSAFAAIVSGHHGVARAGRFILFDPAKGNGVDGMLQEIPFRNREIEVVVKDNLIGNTWPRFVKPMPVNDTYFLVAAKFTAQSLWGLYLVDLFDNVVCLMEGNEYGFISPILATEKVVPPIIPDKVDLSTKESTIFIQDIYEGVGLRGIPKGTVKSLRLHAYEFAYNISTSNHEGLGIQTGWDIKRELGIVPIEEDGSALFKIPANTPISIQPLDENGRAIQWMRSWVTGMPGEVVSCVGCHEDQNTIVMPRRVKASEKVAAEITAPEGGVRLFSFELEVQPMLDRACVSCHNEKSNIDLRGGRYTDREFNTTYKKQAGNFYRYGAAEYSLSYLALHPYVRRQGSEADMAVLQPYEYHANTSDLIRMLELGHYGVELTENEWRKLTQWIDYNVPDKGYYQDIRGYNDCDQYTRRIELTNKYGNGAGVEWKEELENYAKFLESYKDNSPLVPNTMEPLGKLKDAKAKGWPFDAKTAAKLQGDKGKKVINLAKGVDITMVWVPSGEFVMGSNDEGEVDNKPEQKTKISKGFWMSEVEITNEQYAVLMPEHDSRYIDQTWKDHVNPGYPANNPEQPVIRVSYNDILEFCAKFEAETGQSIMLPTEAQWEWACRAGSDEAFWFGGLGSDYAKYENMADATLNEMAVAGVNPKPMKPNNIYYPYYNYNPKDQDVDDGTLLQVDSKSFEANPYGLYSMHGNIAEWTRSPYVSYQSGKAIGDDRIVVRGGSYLDRSELSAAYSRKAYYPWQRIFNVGFRIIIEE